MPQGFSLPDIQGLHATTSTIGSSVRHQLSCFQLLSEEANNNRSVVVKRGLWGPSPRFIRGGCATVNIHSDVMLTSA
jgi:hypothetical protein